jgi:TonB family protein
MRLESDDVLALRSADPPGLQRALRWSFAVHAGAIVLLLVLPQHWISGEQIEPIRMTISLGDGSGARTSGMTPAPGRTVEQVAEPEARPAPIRPAGARDDRMTIPDTTVDRTPPKPVETTAPPIALPRPPAPGRQVARGTAATETGNVGESAGLASGGERGGQRSDFGADFCCPEWGSLMTNAIDQHWASNQSERGVTILTFVVTQNGTIQAESIKVEQSSGSANLDRLAEFAVRQARIPPLPARYTAPTLRVRLRFPYGVQ